MLSGSVAGMGSPTFVVAGEFSKILRAASFTVGFSLTFKISIKTGAVSDNPDGVPPSITCTIIE